MTKQSIVTLVVLSILGTTVAAFALNANTISATKSATNSTVNTETSPNKNVSPTIQVYKSASCGCCKDWIKHLQDNGFSVQAHDVDNLQPYKEQAKLGAGMGSCHTAFVDGYAIEGHVPARDIKRLLLEKPAVSGLTVPAMPIGSPGMEVSGKPAQAYKVLSYKDGQEVGVFADYPAQ